MKCMVLTLMALTPLMQTSAYAQAEPVPENALNFQVLELERALESSRYTTEALRRELDAVAERGLKRKQENEDRVLTAMESELKARLTLDAALSRFASAEQQFQEQQLKWDNQSIELEDQLNFLRGQLNTAEEKPTRLEGDLKTAIYVAENVDGQTLADLASQTFGHLVAYTEASASFSHVSTSQRQRFTSVPRGNQVLVTDFPDQLDKALSLLVEIDASYANAKQASTSDNATRVVFYKPKALNADQVISLISAGSDKLRYIEIRGTGTVRIEGPKSSVDDALALLGQNDNYPPQVRIRAWLIKASVSNSSKPQVGIALPEKLTSGLMGALPGQTFSGLASILVQTSVGSGQQVRTTTMPAPSEASNISEWVFAAGMKSYDSEAGLLSLEQCSFQVQLIGRTERVSTDVLLRKDEFTVVGSIQGGSMYLVLTFEEI
ncbi:MAG: hypothetical protein ACI87O_001403 [Planctomycetota bacterium]|jgi:hypothetical protein